MQAMDVVYYFSIIFLVISASKTSGEGLTLTLKNKPIDANSEVNIADIGENKNRSALICETDLVPCCNTRPGMMRQGNWVVRDTGEAEGGRVVGGSGDGGDMYIVRSKDSEVILNRRNDALEPLGVYCCEVGTMTNRMGESICVTLVAPSVFQPTTTMQPLTTPAITLSMAPTTATTLTTSLPTQLPTTTQQPTIHTSQLPTTFYQTPTIPTTQLSTTDIPSAGVKTVLAEMLHNGTFVLTWQPPDLANGEILYYFVRVTALGHSNSIIKEMNVTNASFKTSALVSGVPYNFSITPVRLAGHGTIRTVTFFTEELTPNTKVKDVAAKWATTTTIHISWKILSLFEARGFVTFYSIAYTPTADSKTSQDTMYVNASADSSSVTIQGLDGDLAYSITVAAATRAGIGVQSAAILVHANRTTTAIGLQVGVIVVVLATAVVAGIAILAFFLIRRRRQYKSSIYNTKKFEYDSTTPELEGDTISLKTPENAQSYENITFSASNHSKLIPVEEFSKHVQYLHTQRDQRFEIEYGTIGKTPQSGCVIAMIPENKIRNRFGNIFPYDFNRVVLKKVPGKEFSDYINASYINGYKRRNMYIAAQGPAENSLEDFWRMIWEYRVPTLVMLTRTFEGRKKCETYWPESTDEEFVPCPGSPLTIEYKSMLPFPEILVREMVVTHRGEPNTLPLEVTQFHYLAWPDHGVPSNAFSMINFIKRVRKAHPYSKQDTLLVHCSAGVGRTGTFITLDSMMERIKTENTINIYEFVSNMRKQRVFMVQTMSQYMFIHDALVELILCNETEILATDIKIITRRLRRIASCGTITGFQAQFEILTRITSDIKKLDISNGTTEHNITKNRYLDVNVPYNHNRVHLKFSAVSGSDYINASFINGYKWTGTYIATQGPLPHTVNDFWRMVWEKEVKCIVMLCNTNEDTCHQYWPSECGESETYGRYKVTLASQDLHSYYIIRKIDVSDSKARVSVSGATKTDSQIGFTVTQFQYLDWPEKGVPQSTTGVLEVANLVQKVQMGSGNKPIVVMCNDGVGRTGAFIAAHAEMERMKAETVIDLFQFIKAARLQRAGLVSNKEQYEFCHQVLADFLDEFDTYANFKKII